jgi:hypothetical protein
MPMVKATDGKFYNVTEKELSLANTMHEMVLEYSDDITENALRLAVYRDTVRAEAKAEALRGAADRAVAWYNSEIDLYQTHEDDDDWWNTQLRAAITQEKPE